MAVYEGNVPVDQGPEMRYRIYSKKCLGKLVLPDAILRDPFSLKNNWLCETEESGLS